jgi:TolB-like protein/DNA-binding SARP family transcriptional activator
LQDGRPLPLGRRSRAILCLLMLEEGCRIRRERLCGLLWPDRPDAQARASLRQCLAELRGLARDLLGSDRESIWFEPDACVSDYSRLVAVLACDDARALADELNATGIAPLADGLHIGDMFDEWLFGAKAALDRRIAHAAATMVAKSVKESDWTSALDLADAWLERDPLDEAVAALAIRAERLRGSPSSAQKRVRQLAEALTRAGLPPPGDAIATALAEEPRASAAFADAMSKPAREPGPFPDKPSVAVLPFAVLTDGASGHSFANVLTEEIGSALSRYTSLFVVSGPRTSSPDAPTRSPRTLGAELGVRYLLEGSVGIAIGRVRITVRVVNAERGDYAWSARYDGDASALFEFGTVVAEQAASAIDSTITEAEMQRAVGLGADIARAYELNLRANARLNAYDHSSIAEALALAEQAVALNPDYAWAVATVGFCHAALLMNGWSSSPSDTKRSAEAAIACAIRIGRDDLMALPVTAGAILNIGGDLAIARRLLERAIELGPDKAFTMFWAGWLELLSDRLDVALERFETARRLDPRSTYRPFQLAGIGNCLFLLGRFEEAVSVQQEVVGLTPAYLPAQFVLAASLARMGRRREGLSVLRHARAGIAGDPPIFRVPTRQAQLRQALELLEDETAARAGLT